MNTEAIIQPVSQHRTSVASTRAAWIIVLLCSLAPWISALDYPFLHDDNWAVVNNPLVDGKTVDVGRIFSSTGWGDIPEYRHVANYRPLSVTSLALTRKVGGLNPLPFRITNALLYSFMCLLLLQFLFTCGCTPLAATLAGAWFAFHGTHVETVMFVVNREIMLATIFYLIGMIMVVRRSNLAANPTAFSKSSLAALGLVTLAGLLSKESAVTMPFTAATILIFAAPQGMKMLSRLKPVAVLFGSTVVYFIIRFAGLGKMSAAAIPWQDNPLVLADTPARLAGAMKVLVESTRLLLAPVNPTVDYGFDVLGLPGPPPGAPVAAIAGGAAILVGTVILVVFLMRRRSAAWPGLMMMMMAYGLVSSIVFPSWIIMGERLLTEPSAGLAAALAVGLTAVAPQTDTSTGRRWFGWGLISLFVVWIGLQAVVTFDRVGDFKSAEKLFESSLANRPGSTRLQNNLGHALMNSGRWAEAEPHLLAAIAIDPANAEAHNNLGLVIANAGRPAAAAAEFTEALKHRPGMISALTNICILLVNHEDYQSALPYCRQAQQRGALVDKEIQKLKEVGL
jgi:hypothetical protein